ncbi:hypothetical protein BaRGS_00013444, partial [Batillaria attramentaria]
MSGGEAGGGSVVTTNKNWTPSVSVLEWVSERGYEWGLFVQMIPELGRTKRTPSPRHVSFIITDPTLDHKLLEREVMPSGPPKVTSGIEMNDGAGGKRAGQTPQVCSSS